MLFPFLAPSSCKANPVCFPRLFCGVSSHQVRCHLSLDRGGSPSAMLQFCCSASPWTCTAPRPRPPAFPPILSPAAAAILCANLYSCSLSSLRTHRTIVSADSFFIVASARSLHVRRGLPRASSSARLWVGRSVQCRIRCAAVSGVRPQRHGGTAATSPWS